MHDCKSTRLHGFKTQQRLEKTQLDSKASTTTRTKIDLKLFRMITQNIDSPESFNLPFFTETLALLSLVKEVTPYRSQNDTTSNI